MPMLLCRLLLLLTAIIVNTNLIAQEITEDNHTISSKYIDKVSAESDHLSSALQNKSAKALARLQKQEAKMRSKLARTDTSKADAVFGDAKQQYASLEQRLQSISSEQYIPSLDTLSTSLKFLQANPQLIAVAKNTRQKLSAASQNIKSLETEFQKADEIKKFLNERKEYLKQQLGNIGLVKQLKGINKTAYYYSEQVSQYQELIKDHAKAERKAIELLSKTKLFKDFMRKNSQLASLFRLPGDPNDPAAQANLAGLQTRAQVTGLLQQQFGTNTQSQQLLQQNMQSAQSQLSQLKDKMFQAGKSSSDAAMPEGFKPNNQKVKSILQRVELGMNIQSQKENGFFPVTSDIGLSAGYKLNDKSIIGIGTSYKVGWGRDIRHIDITHQGAGLRSFIDYKIKGSFWVSGGYEINYRQFPDIAATVTTPAIGGWTAQQSGLIGISKVISLKAKFFKQTKLQLLWDFLSYQQIPRTQPVVFRVGYAF